MNSGRELVLSWLSAYFREPALCAARPLPPVCSSVAAPAGNFRQRVWFAIYTKLGTASEYKLEGCTEKVLCLFCGLFRTVKQTIVLDSVGILPAK